MDIQLILKEIREFFRKNADPEIREKYSRYFKGEYPGYGIDQKKFETRRDKWIDELSGLSTGYILSIGDELMKSGKYEESSLAIQLIAARRNDFSAEVFNHIARWFDTGIDNWAATDTLCMFVTAELVRDGHVSLDELGKWTEAESEWQRRTVPVTLYELAKKKEVAPGKALPLVRPLMMDKSEYVQKGIGTMLRELWKTHPDEIEDFLYEFKDTAPRPIYAYATEKMDKEKRKRFKKNKK
ncbi:MAG: DNA alkylation repair protein [Candidatus Kapaibacterium sp.]